MSCQQYLFGPAPSRRFGRSLGLDLTPFKTCCFDCIFCQLGGTTLRTLARGEPVPMDAALAELREWLDAGGRADYITLSGSGEPTLHSRFGDALEFVRTYTDIPAALLTNGALLHLPEVREAAAVADVVKVSLSAWDQASFKHINRPHPQLEFDQVFEGLRAFGEQFKGALWLEVFLVWGVNSVQADVERIAALVREIGPDRIQVNTAVRPPAEEFALAVPTEQMQAAAAVLGPGAEVIPELSPGSGASLNLDAVFGLLLRRPCTAEQISSVTGMHLNEISKHLGKFMQAGIIRTQRSEGGIFYAVETKEATPRAHL